MTAVEVLRRRAVWLAAGLLGLLAYVPALASSPGRMPADTKLYLYLNPGRLITDAPFSFDARQFAGWVPHQVIAYLWPQGPWYWVGGAAGLPDWVVHRLWIGTLAFLAGTGVLWAARRLGLGVVAALTAALVYQLSPYLIPYVSRTSAMLLPWAGLGWIVGLTVGAATRTKWRDAALLALVVASVGAVNATALLMVVPAPMLWLVVAAAERQITWRRAGAAAARIGGLCVGVSFWWMAMVSLQGRLGADVLAYSESLEAVSFTSTSPEVWRGLGYWLTYIRDPYAATTTAGYDYMASIKIIAAGFLVVLIGVAGLVFVRWQHRRYAIALVVTGVVLGVGVHPIDRPSPLMNLLLGDGESGLALALRSSTRAVPVLLVGLGLGAGMLVEALPAWAGARGTSRVPWRALAAVAIGGLALYNLPVLRHTALVDPALERDQDPPAAWTEASAALDAAPAGYRLWQLPGAEFGAFRWGYTVDPPPPGLTDRPLVTRDLLPLGSAGPMDLAYAMDDRFQSGVAEAGSVAAVARLLGADTIWVTGDAAFDRFRTPRPELTEDLFAQAADDGVPGLSPPVPYGSPAVNEADIPMVDEQALGDGRVGRPVAPVELVPVEEPVPVIRAKDREVVLAGSGDGVIDAAAAGAIDGTELLRYAASLSDEDLAAALRSAQRVIVTDSNRDRAHHWRGSQDVWGFTESGGPDTDVLDPDDSDERLPVFPVSADAAAHQTVAVQDGRVRAVASAYGEPFAYRPEDRAFMAIDGDPTTAWVVADRAPAEGQRLRLEVDEPVDHIVLRQPAGAAAVRHIGEVSIQVDDREPVRVELDDRSLGTGQEIALEPTDGPSTVTITIESVVVPDPTIGPASAAVGFAEVDVGMGPSAEIVRVPTDATSALAGLALDDVPPLTYVLTRLRTRPTDRWRSDPEPRMVREIEVPAAQRFTPEIEVRLDQRASDQVLADLLGITGPVADRRLAGTATAAGWAATDGDPETAWITPFGQAVGATLDANLDAPLSELTITQRTGTFSPVTALRVTSAAGTTDVAVPAAGADGVSRVALAEPIPAGPARIEITAVAPQTTIDRRYGEPVVLPAAITELSVGPATDIPPTFDSGCRDDLVSVDGQPFAIRVTGAPARLLAGERADVEACDTGGLLLDAGAHRIATGAGATTGLQVDRIVLSAPGPDLGAPAPAPGPTATVTSSSRLDRTVTVDGCPDGCWLVLGEGFHESWSARVDGGDDLGPPTMVDGGFNGWWIPPSAGPTVVTLSWTSQTPLTIALALSAVAVVACVVLVLVDRKRRPDGLRVRPARVQLPWSGPRAPRPALVVGAAVWVVGAGLLVGPVWALVAAAASAVLLGALGRPRLAGLASLGVLAFVALAIMWINRADRPFANAGWPARFDWLHRPGLFAAVSLLAAAAGWPRRVRRSPHPSRPSASPPSSASSASSASPKEAT